MTPLAALDQRWTLAHYRAVLSGNPPFWRYLINSLVVGVCSTVLTLVIATPAAYALTRMRNRITAIAKSLLIAAALFPYVLLFLALLEVARTLHLGNQLFALTIPYAALSQPLAILLLSAAFQDLPVDLEDAARLEGLGLWQRLRWVLILIVPVTTSTAILVFPFSGTTSDRLTWISDGISSPCRLPWRVLLDHDYSVLCGAMPLQRSGIHPHRPCADLQRLCRGHQWSCWDEPLSESTGLKGWQPLDSSHLDLCVNDGECLALVPLQAAAPRRPLPDLINQMKVRFISTIKTSQLLQLWSARWNGAQPCLFHLRVSQPELGLKVWGIPAQERQQRALSVRGAAGGTRNQRPSQLSGGQRQRRPGTSTCVIPMYLLDEPQQPRCSAARTSTGITPTGAQRSQACGLRDLINMAMAMADRSLCCVSHRQIATPRELYDTPGSLFVALLIGRPDQRASRRTGSDQAVRPEALRLQTGGVPVS